MFKNKYHYYYDKNILDYLSINRKKTSSIFFYKSNSLKNNLF